MNAYAQLIGHERHQEWVRVALALWKGAKIEKWGWEERDKSVMEWEARSAG